MSPYLRFSRKAFLGTLVLVVTGVSGLHPAAAQTTVIGLRAVPSSSSLNPGDMLTINFYLDVTSLTLGDNYTGAQFFDAYVQNPTGGSIPAASLFAATPTLTSFTGTGASSGFSTSFSSSANTMVSKNGVSYVGFNVSENNGVTTRTDTGTFLLAQASGVLRTDAAAGNYTFGFEDLSATAARTRITGKFDGVSGTFAGLTTSDAAFAIAPSGGADAMPEPDSCPLLLGGIFASVFLAVCLPNVAGKKWLIVSRERGER